MGSIGKRSGMLMSLVAILEIVSFGLLSIRGEGIDYEAFIVLGLSLLILFLQYWFFPQFFRHADRYVMVIVNLLMAVGLIFQYRLSSTTAYKQVICCAAGLIAMIIMMQLILKDVFKRRYIYLYMIFGIILVAVTLVLGRVIGGAKNWLSLSETLSIQPSEFAKVVLVVVLALWLRENHTFRQLIPMFVYVFICVCLLVLAKDLGAALLYFGTFLMMLFVATSSLFYVTAGLGALAVGGVVSYHLFDHVKTRVSVWQNPWSQANDGGYQIVQGLMAIVSGGMFGTGLGLGSPKSIPAYRTDYIFAVVCEEMGVLAGILLIGFYVMLVVRGAIIARRAVNAYHALLALGSTVLIALQSFIIIGGVIKLIPLTGITLPLVSYGGSSMVATFMLIGILQAVSEASGREAEAHLEEDDGEEDV